MDELHRKLAREITEWRRAYRVNMAQQSDRVQGRNCEIRRLRRIVAKYEPDQVECPHADWVSP